uniref:Uncharacterized protein n=1 Tax=Arion vulgaris TaxID=1028688 RepID=A0A0B7AQR7_9EUPU
MQMQKEGPDGQWKHGEGELKDCGLIWEMVSKDEAEQQQWKSLVESLVSNKTQRRYRY